VRDTGDTRCQRARHAPPHGSRDPGSRSEVRGQDPGQGQGQGSGSGSVSDSVSEYIGAWVEDQLPFRSGHVVTECLQGAH
jgi:hypothetical protein